MSTEQQSFEIPFLAGKGTTLEVRIWELDLIPIAAADFIGVVSQDIVFYLTMFCRWGVIQRDNLLSLRQAVQIDLCIWIALTFLGISYCNNTDLQQSKMLLPTISRMLFPLSMRCELLSGWLSF